MTDKIYPWIVCAANRRADGLIGCEQGFIDNRGAFHTREEAHVIAIKNGQRRYRCGGDETRLYSEGLY